VAIDSTDAVEREIRIDAEPETVFAFFTEPELLLRWKGVDAQLDPVPGGTYRVVMHDRRTVLGRYVVVEPPTRLVFTWGFDGEDPLVAPGASTVEVTLAPDGDGTLVRLIHRDLPAPAREVHARGWAHYLDRLQTAARGGDPGPDPWASTD
jgi:uncharacterized protein YndB with AHSA1/START domain